MPHDRNVLTSATKRCPMCRLVKKRTLTFQKTGFCAPCHNIHEQQLRKLRKLHPKTPRICSKCRRRGQTVRDHDHRTGRFRAFLCQSCNLSLPN